MATSTFCGMTLKALLENPDLQHAPGALSGATSSKKKKTGNGPGDVDFTSAFLGPQLWEKTYDDSDFNLEYMDLDEFLSENGIPVVDSPAADELVDSPAISPHCCAVAERSTRCSPPHNPISSTQRLAPSPVQTHTLPIPPSISIMNPGHFLLKPKIEKAEDIPQIQNSSISSAGTLSRGSTPPVSPLPLQVDFNLSEQDIALSSIPGQTTFDPTARNFTEDELKPQPMMRKSKKIFVPEDLKDEKYWARRKKNNCAAKRSRDARRVKENQIAMRAAYLEKENISLKEEMEKMKRENAHLKHLLIKYKSLDNSSKSST